MTTPNPVRPLIAILGGVGKQGSTTLTAAYRGAYREQKMQADFMMMIRGVR